MNPLLPALMLEKPIGVRSRARGFFNRHSYEFLLPVEILQPKLGEDLALDEDENGQEQLIEGEDLRLCRWLDAFSGVHDFDGDFINKDRDRVVVRVPGEVSEDDTLQAFVSTRTVGEVGAVVDDETEVTFERNAGGDFEYTMILVADDIDDSFDPVNNETVGTGSNTIYMGSDNQIGDPTHKVTLSGKVIFRFPSLGDAKIEKPVMEKRRKLQLGCITL